MSMCVECVSSLLGMHCQGCFTLHVSQVQHHQPQHAADDAGSEDGGTEPLPDGPPMQPAQNPVADPQGMPLPPIHENEPAEVGAVAAQQEQEQRRRGARRSTSNSGLTGTAPAAGAVRARTRSAGTPSARAASLGGSQEVAGAPGTASRPRRRTSSASISTAPVDGGMAGTAAAAAAGAVGEVAQRTRSKTRSRDTSVVSRDTEHDTESIATGARSGSIISKKRDGSGAVKVSRSLAP